jgi:hypothetical protein
VTPEHQANIMANFSGCDVVYTGIPARQVAKTFVAVKTVRVFDTPRMARVRISITPLEERSQDDGGKMLCAVKGTQAGNVVKRFIKDRQKVVV